ncbi:MAG TPA: peptidylprolyl isomerase [Gammaproteobacteria bacterium]
MKRILALALLAFAPATALAGDAPAADTAAATEPVFVKLATSDGDIFLELDREKAPVTVANFVQYVKDGHFDGTIFHRVIPGFVAQGGGYTVDFTEKPTREPIQNESKNGLHNLRGTIAMARTPDPHSATSQWYINLVDNPKLNGSDFKWGYAVFGKVVRGMDVVDEIALVPTGPAGPFESDVPFRPVVVKQALIIDALPPEDAPANNPANDKGKAAE